MRNKLKIVAVVLAVITGMVLYKSHFEKKERGEGSSDDNKEAKSLKKAAAKSKQDLN